MAAAAAPAAGRRGRRRQRPRLPERRECGGLVQHEVGDVVEEGGGVEQRVAARGGGRLRRLLSDGGRC